MSTSATDGSIGIQQIMPRSGTAWDYQDPVPVQQNNSPPPEDKPQQPDRAPASQGVGQVVDKLV